MEYVKIHMLMDLLWIGGSEVYIFVQYKKNLFLPLFLSRIKLRFWTWYYGMKTRTGLDE